MLVMAHKHVLFRSVARETILHGASAPRKCTGNYRFDAAHSEYWTLSGIIDPTRVVRIALENVVSVSSVLLVTEAILTELPEKTMEHATALDRMSV